MDHIKKQQEAIIEEFSMLDGDLEMALNYLIELGQELEALPSDSKTDQNIVKGCQSKVWLDSEVFQDKILYKADSNTSITKGLVSLLVRVLSENAPEDVVKAELYFPKEIGMDRFIGTQRSNGFAAMIKEMKMQAAVVASKK